MTESATFLMLGLMWLSGAMVGWSIGHRMGRTAR